MRTTFGVALALSLSLAIVRANETPEPISNDSVSELADLAPVYASDPPRYGNAGWAEPEPSPPASQTPKVCVLLKAESFEIISGKENSRMPVRDEPVASLVCDSVHTSSSAGGATTLKCTNCKLKLPNGVSATANDVAFDSSTNLLMLTGTEKSPVTVTLNGTESKAVKVEMKIDPKAWPMPAGPQSLRQLGASSDPPRIGPSSRY